MYKYFVFHRPSHNLASLYAEQPFIQMAFKLLAYAFSSLHIYIPRTQYYVYNYYFIISN